MEKSEIIKKSDLGKGLGLGFLAGIIIVLGFMMPAAILVVQADAAIQTPNDNLSYSNTSSAGQLNNQNQAPVCPPVGKYATRCHSRLIVDNQGNPVMSATPSGYGPAQFRGAYSLSGVTATKQTIAVVDAYDDPNIFTDLNKYSRTFGIPTMKSCPVSTGTPSSPCFQKVNQSGGTSYPPTNSGWALEISLDVEIVHAICQNCNILLVESDTAYLSDLGTAVNQAVKMGANAISNSYGAGEFLGEDSYDGYYNHPGIAVTASSGDGGYGLSYPAASQYVTAVGGTTLYLSGNSYLGESAWGGAGSGCSLYEPQPSFQTSLGLTGCANRMVADISADADPNTGAAIYDSVPYQGGRGWIKVGGTSLSSPLIAGVYALAGGVGSGVQGNSIPYSQGNYSTNLHDILSGSNGNCGVTYLCNAVQGYDGPTGLGTPNGIGAY